MNSDEVYCTIECVTKKYFPKQRYSSFARYLYLIQLNLRNAYLIDCCGSLNYELLNEMMHEIRLKLKDINQDDSFPKLVIVQLGIYDFILVQVSTWLKKCSLLEEKENFPIVCCICGDRPILSNDNFNAKLKLLLDDKIKSLAISEDHFIQLDFTSDGIGFPMIAGWLLSYPVIYHFLQDESTMFKNALAFQQLTKFSFQADICLRIDEYFRTDIMEFSCPTALLDTVEISETFDSKLAHIKRILLEKESSSVRMIFSQETFCLANPVL